MLDTNAPGSVANSTFIVLLKKLLIENQWVINLPLAEKENLQRIPFLS